MIPTSELYQQNLLNGPVPQEARTKFNQLFVLAKEMKNKWIKLFQASIDLWINFITLKIQCIGKNYQNGGAQFCQQERDVRIFVSETDQAVRNSLKNIEKLYLVPQLRNKSRSKSKQCQNNLKSRNNSINRSRSNSLTSNKGGRSLLFNKSIKQSFTRSLKQNSTVSKQFKKPKFEKEENYHSNGYFGSTITSNLPIQTLSNFSKNVVQQELSKSVSAYFQDKNKKGSKSTQQTTNSLQQKLKILESDLSSKMDMIISNISSMKKQYQKHQIKQSKSAPVSQPHEAYQNQRVGQIIAKQSQAAEQINQRKSIKIEQKIVPIRKKSKMLNKSVHNPILQQNDSQIEQVQLSAHKNNQQQKQTNEQTNGMGQNWNVQNILKLLQQFVNQTKKVKLPISDQILTILFAFYFRLCNEHGCGYNLDKLSLPQQHKQKYLAVLQEQFSAGKNKKKLKELLNKLKKLFQVVKQDLAEKLKCYVEHCIKCIYLLIFRQECSMACQTGQQMNTVIDMLQQR